MHRVLGRVGELGNWGEWEFWGTGESGSTGVLGRVGVLSYWGEQESRVAVSKIQSTSASEGLQKHSECQAAVEPGGGTVLPTVGSRIITVRRRGPIST